MMAQSFKAQTKIEVLKTGVWHNESKNQQLLAAAASKTTLSSQTVQIEPFDNIKHRE
jgi:hypothetical protein